MGNGKVQDRFSSLGIVFNKNKTKGKHLVNSCRQVRIPCYNRGIINQRPKGSLEEKKMAGYNGFSMSNNAVAAYDDGLVPASKIKGVPAALVEAYCRYEEWHHSSKAFNKVKFYNPQKVRAEFGIEVDADYEINPLAVEALAAHKAAKVEAPIVHSNCKVKWIEWSGSLKRPKATEMEALNCTVSVKGQTATITFIGGGVFTKRLTTNGFSFHVQN